MPYDFSPGHLLARKYEVISRLGAGHGGELYMLSERATGIERTAKFFHPSQNPGRIATLYAKKLHRLRHCDILMQYRTQETISFKGHDTTFLVSDLMPGEPLGDFLKRQPGGKLPVFEALHLLHALATGVEKVHAAGSYHGVLKSDNVVVRRRGLGFQVKLIDLEPGEGRRPDIVRDDVYDLVALFLEALGGPKIYAKLPHCVKAICCGLRRPLIAEKFRDAGDLKRHLETMDWR